MKRLACLIAATAAVSAAGAEVDPLWTLAQQRAAAARPWVAQTVRSDSRLEDAGKPARTATATAALSGWDGVIPLRQVTMQGDAEVGQLAQRALPRVINPADRPDGTLLPATSVSRDGTPQPFEGHTAQAFAVRGTTGARQNGFTGRVLVDTTSGDLLEASYEFAPAGPLKAIRYSVHFPATQPGQAPPLPDHATLQVDVRMPLLGETTIKHSMQMTDWALRPPAALLPAEAR